MRSFIASVTFVALAGALYALQGIDPSTLPPSADRELLFRVCSECHGVEDALVERRPASEWRSVADDMIRRGAQASDDEIKTIVAYLSVHAGRVNVNRASADDLKTVLELTKDQADAIVAFRTQKGDFHVVDDVKKVPGIDARAIDERKDRIVFTGQ